MYGAFEVSRQAEERHRRTLWPERNRTLISIFGLFPARPSAAKRSVFFIPLDQMTMPTPTCVSAFSDRQRELIHPLNIYLVWPKTGISGEQLKQYKQTKKPLYPLQKKISGLLLTAFVQLPTKMFTFSLLHPPDSLQLRSLCSDWLVV